MNIGDLKDGERKVKIAGKAVAKSDTRNVKSTRTGEELQVADVTLQDKTGTITLTLWNEKIKEVNVGDTVVVNNGYTNSFRDEVKLNVGRYGTLTVL